MKYIIYFYALFLVPVTHRNNDRRDSSNEAHKIDRFFVFALGTVM